MAGVIVPGATAAHGLELPIGELASLDIRRPAGKHQVDGLCGLLHRCHLDALGQPRTQLFLEWNIRGADGAGGAVPGAGRPPDCLEGVEYDVDDLHPSHSLPSSEVALKS
jgi:hypothetical protein